MFYFPHPLSVEKDGLLAIGGDLEPERLLLAYRYGIFPWYNEPPILWWYTHPRCILYPEKLKISKSMRPYLNQQKFQITVDLHFSEVMRQCALVKRKGQKRTWINEEMISSYSQLHEAGYAHSIEVWEAGNLVGGLYGLALGRVFFGESMFSLASNASKYATIHLCQLLVKKEFEIIDCQQKTDHMMRFGAEMMGKKEFFDILQFNRFLPDQIGKWKIT